MINFNIPSQGKLKRPYIEETINEPKSIKIEEKKPISFKILDDKPIYIFKKIQTTENKIFLIEEIKPEDINLFVVKKYFYDKCNCTINDNLLIPIETVSNEKRLAFIMENMDGNLIDLVNNLKNSDLINIDEKFQIFYSFCKQILNGVFELHSRGILHLNLKPNVILFKYGKTISERYSGIKFKITGFDYSCFINENKCNQKILNGSPFVDNIALINQSYFPRFEHDIYSLSMIILEFSNLIFGFPKLIIEYNLMKTQIYDNIYKLLIEELNDSSLTKSFSDFIKIFAFQINPNPKLIINQDNKIEARSKDAYEFLLSGIGIYRSNITGLMDVVYNYNVNDLKVYKIELNEKLNKYYLLREIGRGSFGIVYKIQDKTNKQYYALKTIKLDNNLSKGNEKTFFENCECFNENILKPIEIIVSENKREIGFISELMKDDLDNLKEVVSKSNYNISYKYWIFYNFSRQILNGLDYLHKNNIIHYDLKPQNILYKFIPGIVLPDNINLKITDFGLSCFLANKEPICNYSLRGSKRYMDPLCLRYGITFNRFESDIYSICFTLLQFAVNLFGIFPIFRDISSNKLENIQDLNILSEEYLLLINNIAMDIKGIPNPSDSKKNFLYILYTFASELMPAPQLNIDGKFYNTYSSDAEKRKEIKVLLQSGVGKYRSTVQDIINKIIKYGKYLDPNYREVIEII
jgi:serine/threonine protein kinase